MSNDSDPCYCNDDKTPCRSFKCPCGRWGCWDHPTPGCDSPGCKWSLCCDNHLYAYCGWKAFCKDCWFSKQTQHHSHDYQLAGQPSSGPNNCPLHTGVIVKHYSLSSSSS